MENVLITENEEDLTTRRIDLHYENVNVGYLVYERARTVWIDGLYIHPAYRRIGYATILMKYFLNKYNNETITLYASPFEKDEYTQKLVCKKMLIKFYESFGFKIEYGNKMTRYPNI